MLKYNKKRSWDLILVAKTSEILSDTLLLVDVSKTSLGGVQSFLQFLYAVFPDPYWFYTDPDPA